MQTVSFAGNNYNIPNQRGDTPWSGLSDFAIAAAGKALSTFGGNFTLTDADINLGASFGLVSTYFKSRSSNIADAGVLRLANTDTIKWRNGANDNNLTLDINTNRLRFEGSRLLIAGAAEIVNADISASAAIAYSKLALTGSILNADINAAAAIAYSKLALTGSIVNGDLTAGTLLNSAINASAAIALSKLATVTASRVLVSDGSGFVSASSVTTTTLGFLDATSSIQTQLNAKASLALDNLASTAVNTDIAMGTHKLTGLAAGTANGNSVRYEQVFPFRVLQIVTDSTTSGTTTNSATYVDTNLSLSITPASTSSKILLFFSGDLQSSNASSNCVVTFTRSDTDLVPSGTGFAATNNVTNRVPASAMFIDSPSTTSATTYKVRVLSQGGNNVTVFQAQACMMYAVEIG